jgi:hypothetical protein
LTVKLDLEDFIKTVIWCLEESKIKYVLVGGVAAIIYGRPRTTTDVDIVVDNVNIDDIKRLEKVLKAHGFSLQENEILDAVNERSHCSIFLKDYLYRIDIQGTYSPLDLRSLNNRLLMKIYDQNTYIEKAEDLIIAKLVFSSPQDYEDVHSILLRQKDNLDFIYLESVAKLENVEEQLQKILSDLEIK